MRTLRLLLLSGLCFSVVLPAAAQQRDNAPQAPQSSVKNAFREYEIKQWIRSQTRFDGNYRETFSRLRKDKERIYNNVRALRSFYPMVSWYTPFSEKLVDDMTSYAYIMDTSEDQIQKNQAFNAYHELLNDHLMSIDVVEFALTMSRLDARYGNEDFLQQVRASLIKDMLFGANGTEPERAYRVVSHGEEAFILAQKGGEVKKSEMYPVNRKFYNVHDVVYEDGSFERVYFDVTMPIRNMQFNNAVKERDKVLDIVPQ